MIGLTIMDIHEDEMKAIVQFYLNNNLLNVVFKEHHQSVVEAVRQRSNGRFVIEFREAKGRKKTVEQVKVEATTVGASVGGEG
jgi:hypothetical protein